MAHATKRDPEDETSHVSRISSWQSHHYKEIAAVSKDLGCVQRTSVAASIVSLQNWTLEGKECVTIAFYLQGRCTFKQQMVVTTRNNLVIASIDPNGRDRNITPYQQLGHRLRQLTVRQQTYIRSRPRDNMVLMSICQLPLGLPIQYYSTLVLLVLSTRSSPCSRRPLGRVDALMWGARTLSGPPQSRGYLADRRHSSTSTTTKWHLHHLLKKTFRN
jgi:hypothetical protein